MMSHITRLGSLVPSKLAIGLAVLPLAIPVTYLLYLDRVVSTRFITVTGVRDKTRRRASGTTTAIIPPDIPKPASLPEEVWADEDGAEWVLAFERVVSEPLALSKVPPPPPPPPPPPHPSSSSSSSLSAPSSLHDLVTRYVRATMAAFSRTPQAWLLWAAIDARAEGGAEARRTFTAPFIAELAFRPGDRVNGFWKVTYRGGEHYHHDDDDDGERVEMVLDPAPGYRGGSDAVRGLIVAGVETTRAEDGPRVVFVNETWMWRRQGEEAPVLLERPLGSWLHTILAGWLVMRGLKAVSENGQVRVLREM